MKILKTILFLISPIFLCGQQAVINTSLKTRDTAILYLGVENNLLVLPSDKITYFNVKVNGTPLKRIDSFYVYQPSQKGTDTIQVYRHSTLVNSKIFKVDTISDPKLYVANSTLRQLKKSELLQSPYLVFKRTNCYYNANCIVWSFECVIQNRSKGSRYFEGGRYGKFTDEMIKEIKILNSGDIIKFDRIRVGCSPGYCPRAIDSIEIKIE
jgi:GldM C-terminal domain